MKITKGLFVTKIEHERYGLLDYTPDASERAYNAVLAFYLESKQKLDEFIEKAEHSQGKTKVNLGTESQLAQTITVDTCLGKAFEILGTRENVTILIRRMSDNPFVDLQKQLSAFNSLETGWRCMDAIEKHAIQKKIWEDALYAERIEKLAFHSKWIMKECVRDFEASCKDWFEHVTVRYFFGKLRARRYVERLLTEDQQKVMMKYLNQSVYNGTTNT